MVNITKHSITMANVYETKYVSHKHSITMEKFQWIMLTWYKFMVFRHGTMVLAWYFDMYQETNVFFFLN